ncbi:unnamed protein product [Phytophthora fragariaefolia]|uniref:Unnamed protein product n=1 Tax=Phytophthora fragariaefolia TaxID=1490495 RepID=A0A9W6Y1P3_9STRA|nr:unnamed protein product [Phytophthora fragariaefolia]
MRPGLVLSVQSGGASAAVPDMWMFVTKTVIPAHRVLPDQNDVDMAEVESAETRSSKTASRRRSARSRTAVKPEKLESAPSESGLISEGLQQSYPELAPRSVSGNPDQPDQSISAFRLAVFVRTQLSQAQLDMRLKMQRELQNASFEVRAMKEEVSRVQAEKTDAERALAELNPPAWKLNADPRKLNGTLKPQRIPAYAAVQEGHFVSAYPDVAEAVASLASQRYEADRKELEQHRRERQDEAEASHQCAEAERARREAERARRAEEADSEMKKRLDSVQQTIQNILLERERAERELECDTVLNRQKFLADQNRELRATLSEVQSVHAATHPSTSNGNQG